MWKPPVWPRGARALGHVVAAGLLMHAINLAGSHHAQAFGLSAGITALILATQPLLTAVVADRWLRQPLDGRQWLGVALGLAGVLLVVWHKIDARAAGVASLIAVGVSLAAVTAGTLYQRVFCADVDLRAAALIQFAASLLLLLPLAWGVEDFAVRWTAPLVGSVVFLVVFASIGAVSALHALMRQGNATRVTSLLYLTPIVATLLEWLLFGVAPTLPGLTGIAITCAGVAMIAPRPR
jgi:drug/metabolite transporter (DMT)-like permease